MKTIVYSVAAMLGLCSAQLFAQTPPTGVDPTAVQANVTLAVDTVMATGVTARAHVAFLDYHAVLSQAAPWRDNAGRFILDATVEALAVIAIYPPPPKPVVDLTYRLGVLPAGGYTAVFRMNGKEFAETAFTVPVPPPLPPPVQVTMQVITTATGSLAKARVVFPDGYWVLSDPGVALRDGTNFSIDAKANRIETLVPPSGPAVFEPQYPLGLLPAGSYSITYRINGAVTGVFPFTVPPPVPQLAFINFRQGDVSIAAEVGVTVPSGITVTEWGVVVRDGSSFRVALIFGPSALTATPVNAAAMLLRHTYSLGVVEPGAYRMTVYDSVEARVLGTRDFTVVPPTPPPLPPPPPLVAYLQPGQDTPGWFVEVGLAFPRPGLEVKDWGMPVRDGNLFRAAITWGPALPSVTAYDSAAGGVPVIYCPSEPANEPPSVVDPAVSESFREICGWPSHLVRHRYPLGALEPGEYVFVVNLGDRDVARRELIVPAPVTPGPLATLFALPLTSKTADPYTFRIVFNAAVGWDGEPGKGKVTVTGPNGFSGFAKLLATVPSMDPLGRLFDCTYALTGPGNAWDAADNGEYRVSIDLAAVLDRKGRTLPRSCLGVFPVRIRPEVPPTELQVDVAVEMRDGRWLANVAFENTGGWFAAEWSEVRVNGNVFVALAVLKPLPPGAMAPIPASFGHTFMLGSPPPGTYSFVFKSSAGHCATAPFVVPGVEPATPVEGWAINTGTRNEADCDDDDDGWPNLAEFYLAMRPQVGDQPAMGHKVVTRDGRRHFAMEFRRLNGVVSPVRVAVEVSRDLRNWTDAGELVDWIAGAPDPDGTEAVEVVQKMPINGKEWPFMRLRVEDPPVNGGQSLHLNPSD